MSDVLVLCYHAVSSSWTAPLAISPRRLEHQLRAIVRRGYVGTTFRQAMDDPPARRTVAVTFDDAYRSVVELAAPILSELGLPGSVYAPSDYIGSDEPMSWPGIEQWLGTPHERELVPASWDELARLEQSGWEIGSHTCTHPRLSTVGDLQLARELESSRAAIARRLGTACDTIAYPYGDVDERVVRAARAAGYRHGAALPDAPHGPRALEWPRVGVYCGDTAWRFRAKVSPLVRRLRGSG